MLIAFFLKVVYHIALYISPVYLASVLELYNAPFEVDGQATAIPIPSWLILQLLQLGMGGFRSNPSSTVPASGCIKDFKST